MTITGFPAETVEFLRGIRAHNGKARFDQHRADYESFYMQPARDFVVSAGERLRVIDPGVQAEPRVLGSIARINRDTRFSKDKRPHKDHLDLWFWEGERKLDQDAAVASLAREDFPLSMVSEPKATGYSPV